ncbi:AAA family ATPase [Phormidium pseudopriestleyi FRX01]|uniref:histidine kinase n=1 Tax=Phormidium pseudopriestleyi FRX01 TaxID=1759528 RepID=A0ABS3FM11_9CYAN|nr:AAA family ATPase [Phormidium pseudopriestleyi]MBO0348125.1 AAA family ATPase [Phormidium pseudopriestleyi FRX01]
MNILGYELAEPMETGLNTIIYRGYNATDGTTAIFKVLASPAPTIEDLIKFRNEYEICKNLDIPGIVKPLALTDYQNSLALVLEDFGGQSLKKSMDEKPLTLAEFLHLGIQLTTSLGKLHQHQIVHKDIKPQNLILNPGTGEIKITDFSIAMRLSSETSWSQETVLEGTLSYMSPEQTGRMNRAVDYRTDFYSLGVTFYEMLTGRLPFEAVDALELIYCHIAKVAVSPNQINPQIPQAVADIVMKLMAKTAEDRYQTSQGLLFDLETCLTQLEAKGTIEVFPVGERDRASQLLIPQKLYGREQEVETLMATFHRVAQGSREMMLVSGYSGIGKSALVAEVHKPIVGARGYFISGKYDQYKRNIPYAGLIQAFSELIDRLLTESPDRITFWQQQLTQALGSNGQAIVEVIPKVEAIIGPQPPIAELGPIESQNRFNRVFQQFLQIFCKKEHPLVIFLDDLQWADTASLHLIYQLINDLDNRYFLLIGAYRDNEVNAVHPLIQTLDSLQSMGATVNQIVLQPLEKVHVNELIADTLDEPDRSRPLAELLYNKTQGNPFFLTQLLKTLWDEKLLSYEFSVGLWQWDIDRILAVGIADRNVVELMARNIQKLPESTQNILQLAACVGNTFTLEVLAIVSKNSPMATAAYLWSALESGLILPLSSGYKIPLLIGDEGEQSFDPKTGVTLSDLLETQSISYKFLHDRVQQAAYSLIQEEQKKETHLKIGKLLLHNIPLEEREETIFALVNQLNYGCDLLETQAEKDELAQLNAIAGNKAKVSTAYEAALRYLKVGIGLLGENSWDSQYELTLSLYVSTLDAEYLNGNFEAAQTLAEMILDHAKAVLDRVKVYEIQMQIYAAQHHINQAIETGLAALNLMGISLTVASKERSQSLQLPDINSIAELPEMTDPNELAVMRILMNLVAPALHSSQVELCFQLVLTALERCLEKGHSAIAAFTYSWYATLLCGSGDIERGYYAAQISVKLLERFQAKTLKCQVYNMVFAFVQHWKQPVKVAVDALQEGLQSGLEVGDLEYASYCACKYCSYLFLSGESLETVARKQTPYIELLHKLKYEIALYDGSTWRQLVANLQGLAPDQYRLVGDVFNEDLILPKLKAANDGWSLFNVYLAKTILNFLLKQRQVALTYATLADEYSGSVSGAFTMAVHNFYYSLVLLSVYPSASAEEQQKYLQQVECNQDKMKKWAELGPMNYQHKYELVEAEKARVLGRSLEAMDAYERAIAGAKENGYLPEEALGYELASNFYRDRHQDKFADTYLTESSAIYTKWGAKIKVDQLEAKYPQLKLLQPAPSRRGVAIAQMTTATTFGSSAALDLATVIKASQAISSELQIEKLVEKLMNILLENAGAQKGFLVLAEGENLILAAEVGLDKKSQGVKLLDALDSTADLPWSIIHYVRRTQNYMVLNDAIREGLFTNDRYVSTHQVKSLLCAPFVNQGKLVGIVYLENNLTRSAFTHDRLEVLRLLSGQAAISIDLARTVNQLQDTVAYLNAIVNNIADGLLVTDMRDRISRLNPALLEMFGLPATELQGQDCQKGLSSELASLVSQSREHLAEVLSAEIPLTNNRIGKAVATSIVTESTGEDSDPSCIGTVTLIRDITTEKEVDRMKTDFISTVSHELRTPLTSVVGFAKIVNKKLQDKIVSALGNADQKTQKTLRQVMDNIEIIISEGERLTNLINDVLDIAKMEAGKVEWQMQPISLSELMERAIASTSSLFQSSQLQVQVEIQPELPQVSADRDRLLQVLINLISNAVKFTDTGTVTLCATQNENDEQVVVSIIDTGIGIPTEFQDTVFEKFKQVGDTLTDKPRGTGLGLPICKQIIEHHGGKIWVESTPAQGSNFSFSLPPLGSSVTPELEKLNLDSFVKQLKERIVTTPERETDLVKTILVVDDDTHIRSLLRQELESCGYQVREAKDGMEAIAEVKSLKPDLILLDVMMPQISGFDVAAVLKHDPETMDIPIIILSIIEDKQRGYRLGIDRYLTKPIDTEKLFENIGALLSKGASKKNVIVVDEDAGAVKTLVDVLEAKGYSVVEAATGQECIEKAMAIRPDMIVLNSVLSEHHEIVKTLRFEKGLENVLFLLLDDDGSGSLG